MAPYISSYNQQNRGLWAQTATIDWCESNYELSYFIAEFWNTLSNVAFIVPELAQYFALSRHKNVELVFRRAFLSLALVGIGSFCFHMTLARHMQMFDETSMILVSLHGFYLLYIIRKPSVNRNILIALLICYGLIFFSLYIFLVDRPVFHHTTFGLLVYASAGIGYQLKQRHGPHYKYWTVITLQHFAFLLWLIDHYYCETLTALRENHVPMLLKPAFQFHALWHMFMGLSSHLFICGLIRLRVWTKYKEEFVIKYKWFGLWIVLEKIDPHLSPLADLENQKQRKEKLLANINDKHQLVESLKLRRLQPSTANNLDEELDLNQNQVYSYNADDST